MKNKRIVTLGQEGFPKKEVLNFDEETYSALARPEMFPVSVKIPSEYVLEKINSGGHAYFVDEGNFLWGHSSGVITKKDLSDMSTPAVNTFIATNIDPQARDVDYVVRTATVNGSYNIIVFLNVTPNNEGEGGRIYVSSNQGTSWTKVLDLTELNLSSHFRPSNVVYEKIGNKEYIFAGSYGNNDAADKSFDNGVWRSLDAGLTWQKIITLPKIRSVHNNHVHAIALSKHNGWLWIPHGDGDNRGILYSKDAMYSATPTIKAISEGQFTKGGWQPSSVVTTALGAYFGTDTEAGLPNGLLGYDLPEKTEVGKLGFKLIVLDEDADTLIARRGAQINGSVAYIPTHQGAGLTRIMATGDGGFSWHLVLTAPFMFEKGFSSPDKDGYVYGTHIRFKVTKWETVTKWVSGQYAQKVGYL